MTILFYSHRSDEYAAFSNFSDHSFVLDGYRWPTSEHYFQAQKFPPGSPQYMKILRAKTPALAKRFGREEKMRPDWDSIRIGVMDRVLKAKFSQNPDLRDLLLSTGDQEIVEDSPTDNFWGKVDGKGENALGKCLMKLRQKFRDEEVKSSATTGG